MKIPPALLMVTCMLCPQALPAADLPPPAKVEIARTADGYRLLRDGKPYTIRGAGMSVDRIETFAAYGGNSIRNWTTENKPQDIRAFLDSAYASGVTVMLCLPMQHERWGLDYDDEDAVASQLEYLRGEVLKYRDHPALLAWIIGNELNHDYTNPRVYDAVNDVAKMIHELDPNHPTTTTVAGFFEDVVQEIVNRAPALDFISFQAYGMLFAFPELMEQAGFDRPFVVTEWGAIGHWEVGRTDWGAPIEATSSRKAEVFRQAHEDVLKSFGGQLLGSYAFYWGQKQERTPTWFGMLTEDGEETEAVDVLQHIWTGTWPENRAPQVRAIRLAGRAPESSLRLQPGERVPAAIVASDPDGDPLTYRWELKPESDATQVGGDFERSIESLPGFIGDPGSASPVLEAPPPGAYRLFAYVYDGQGHAGHANFPFLVEDKPAK
jgi:hypothetical protein